MCAINPTHKKRFIIDVYTSDPKMSKYEFENKVVKMLLMHEIKLNSAPTRFRFHLKESKEEAD